jgi:hypothetical protein
MLDRSPSPDALRASRSRATLKAGIRIYRVRAHTLVAACAGANPLPRIRTTKRSSANCRFQGQGAAYAGSKPYRLVRLGCHKGSWLDPLEDGSDALAAADAHGHQGVAPAEALQLVERLDR